MGLYKDIGTAWKEAMKARDPKKDVLSSIRTEVTNKVINTRSDGAGEIDAPDDVVLDVLGKMAKQRKESIEEYKKGGRQDLVDKESFELSVIESFLPQKMSADELNAAVKQAITDSGATSAKDMGKVMKVIMERVKGRADGKDVQTAVKAALPS
jgi:uncharacterized protein